MDLPESYEDFASLMTELSYGEADIHWWLGYYVAEVVNRFGEDQIGKLAYDSGRWGKMALWQHGQVAKTYGWEGVWPDITFPIREQYPNLSWSHFLVAVPLPENEQRLLLEEANDNSWSIPQMKDKKDEYTKIKHDKVEDFQLVTTLNEILTKALALYKVSGEEEILSGAIKEVKSLLRSPTMSRLRKIKGEEDG